MQNLLDCLQARFEDLNALKSCFAFFADLFHVDVISDGFPVSKIFATNSSAAEIELQELKEDLVIKMYHESHSIIHFWKQVPESKYSELKKICIGLFSIFSTTYSCESLYSIMGYIKYRYYGSLTNDHLTELIRIAVTTYRPDFKQLTESIETHKSSV